MDIYAKFNVGDIVWVKPDGSKRMSTQTVYRLLIPAIADCSI